MAKFKIIIYTPQELNHSSYIQTGLFELEADGIIEVKVVLTTQRRLGRYAIENNLLNVDNRPHPKTSFYKLINLDSKEKLFFATDLYDFANQFSKEAIEKCDFIFKRSFESKYVEKLPRNLQHKIYPLGLCFGVRSIHQNSQLSFLLGLFGSNLKINTKLDRSIGKRWINTWYAQQNHWKFIKTGRELKRFKDFQKANESIILFQTRCFKENQQDVINIHEQRYYIIKLLKKEFPEHFRGGFIKSKFFNEKYRDALSNVPSDPEEYLDVLKSAKIVIYTRGLANSPAWKMAEYLSQGKIIIAEPLSTELPVPLEHGKHLLYFHSDKELITNIKLVLADDYLGDRLSANARQYFEEYVSPEKNVKRILELMNRSL